MMLHRLVGVTVLLAAWAAPTLAASPFDGTWAVTLVCPQAADGAFGYTYRFGATVTDGVLHGENGVRGMPSWLALDGRIQLKGLTGAGQPCWRRRA